MDIEFEDGGIWEFIVDNPNIDITNNPDNYSEIHVLGNIAEYKNKGAKEDVQDIIPNIRMIRVWNY